MNDQMNEEMNKKTHVEVTRKNLRSSNSRIYLGYSEMSFRSSCGIKLTNRKKGDLIWNQKIRTENL
jgi:hypothetical protein